MMRNFSILSVAFTSFFIWMFLLLFRLTVINARTEGKLLILLLLLLVCIDYSAITPVTLLKLLLLWWLLLLLNQEPHSELHIFFLLSSDFKQIWKIFERRKFFYHFKLVYYLLLRSYRMNNFIKMFRKMKNQFLKWKNVYQTHSIYIFHFIYIFPICR